jgi:glutamate-1-semialdehyde 2,1-aminomutase
VSGSTAPCPEIRIARGFTGREPVVKMLGAYHGHHDAVMVSVGLDPERMTDRFELPSIAHGAGMPAARPAGRTRRSPARAPGPAAAMRH